MERVPPVEFSAFEDEDSFTGLPVTDAMLERAEAELGVRLPRAYVALLRHRNGGRLVRRCCPTPFPTSWAPDHFEVEAVLGIGYEGALDGEYGSPYMVEEWGYPPVGVAFCTTPSAGHDTVMLDYSECGPAGEPAVVYVDEDRVPQRVAGSFDEFLAALVDCAQFEDDD